MFFRKSTIDNGIEKQSVITEINPIKTDCSFSFTNITLMRFLPHAHRISLLSPAPVSHIFHSCRPSMPRKQKAASVPTHIKQSHKAMVVSYRPQTLHDTIHTVLPGEVLPAIKCQKAVRKNNCNYSNSL